ncbi:hypothetical protein GF325_06080 [Candidatus Bathyarchaeota archaeon]|nr:hypothetical protein [Candidatus Bathyarchaeota archaeon]
MASVSIEVQFEISCELFRFEIAEQRIKEGALVYFKLRFLPCCRKDFMLHGRYNPTDTSILDPDRGGVQLLEMGSPLPDYSNKSVRDELNFMDGKMHNILDDMINRIGKLRKEKQ